MHWLTALFLTIFIASASRADSVGGSVQDWSKKVVELQEKEGQNFEQDLLLVKGYLYLQRRLDALQSLNRLLKSNKKDSRLMALYTTATQQFFFQETAELYSDARQMVREERWLEAKEKADSAIQKEPAHAQLVLLEIQLGIVLGQIDSLNEHLKTAELYFSEMPAFEIYSAWIALSKPEVKENLKEIHRKLAPLWQGSEVAALLYLRTMESYKSGAELNAFLKVLKKHPEWIAVRVWKLKNKALFSGVTESDHQKEKASLKEVFQDLSKLKNQREKENKETHYAYSGIISLEKQKAQFEEGLPSAESSPTPVKN